MDQRFSTWRIKKRDLKMSTKSVAKRRPVTGTVMKNMGVKA